MEEPRRKPQRKLSPEEKDGLRKILNDPSCPKRADGAFDYAAISKMTGLSYGQVYNFVLRDSYQRTKLLEVDASKLVPHEAAMVDGPPITPPSITLTDDQIKEYQALVRQNKRMLAKDWEALGMTPDAGLRMEKYGAMGAAPTGQLLRTVSGQLISNIDLLDQIVKKDSEMILKGRIPTEIGKDGEARDTEAVERDWRYAVFSGMKLHLEMFTHIHKVQALMARVMGEWQKLNGNKPKGEKGTFDADAT